MFILFVCFTVFIITILKVFKYVCMYGMCVCVCKYVSLIKGAHSIESRRYPSDIIELKVLEEMSFLNSGTGK